LGSTVCNLVNINAFNGAGLSASDAAIYVLPSLVSAYQAAARWSTYSSIIQAYSE